MSPSALPVAGRVQRRNAPQTKLRIIDAAQNLFATKGYAHTGIRDVANAASVAVSLVPAHFGSKAQLFEAALLAALAAMAASRVLDIPDSQLASSLVERGLSDEDDFRLPAMIVLCIGDPDGSEIAGRFVREHVVPSLARRLGPPNAHERAMEIVMISTGFLLYARQLPAGTVDPLTIRNITHALQAVVDRK
jgi:AcrR family transcriptional regulator